MNIIYWTIGGLLIFLTIRRYLYWFSSLAPQRETVESRDASIVVLVAAHNEARTIRRLLMALEGMDYPAELLGFVLVSDGSTDTTPAIIEDWVLRRPRARSLILRQRGGKSAALRAAFAMAPIRDLIVVVDADTIPEPRALARLAGALADSAVGAACGYPDPGLSHRSVVAKYAALERWVTHLVTLAGKDRLGFQPPVIGALCCIRTEALVDIGGFPTGAVAEDISLSLALSGRGWKTRWVRAAAAREDVPTDFKAFRSQRLRWSRGLMSTWTRASRLEDLLVAAGYLDRLVFVVGAGLAVVGHLPAWIPIAYAMAPVVVIVTALWRAGPPGKLGYLAAVAPMAFMDVAITLESVFAQLVRAPVRWGGGGRRGGGA